MPAVPGDVGADLLVVPRLTAPPHPPVGARAIALQGAAMGTGWSLRAFAPPALAPAAVRAAVAGELASVVAEISTWEPGSEISRFNAAAAGTWHRLSEGHAAVLGRALQLAAATGGAFDPALAALVDLWGFGPAGPVAAPPGRAAVAAGCGPGAWRRLRFDPAERLLLQPGGVRLDLSAIGKGHAVDRVAAVLRRLGLRSFLMELGGELRGEGVKPDATPWWVGLDRPEPGPVAVPQGGARVLIALHGLSVATSGDYCRHFAHRGRRYGHILDPRSGAPAQSDLAAVTVLHPDCMTADAMATALAVLGPERGAAFAEAQRLAALFRLRNGGAWSSGALAEMTG